MTAFARVQTDFANTALVWELRSVNHRFLEVHYRLPENLRSLEQPLRETTRKHLKRGKIDGSLRIDTRKEDGVLEVNRSVLVQLLAALEQIRRDAPESHTPTTLELLRWPGVLGEEQTLDEPQLMASVTDLYEQALTDLLAHREREGAQLAQTVATRLDDIDAIIFDLKGLSASLTDELAARLRQRIEGLEISVDPDRLEAEIVLAAQKADIAEELDRLAIHVEEARSQLNQHGPHGRRLDFLTQELNREANTIGSKSALIKSSQRAVDLKVIIEQIREQVQNVE
jgi:uncharacterized protein (TIGR00255 family)